MQNRAALVGRDQDIAVVRAFVDHASRHGGSLVVSGEAGVGKTALIDTAAEYAASSGLQLARANGAQFEANVSFAALCQRRQPGRAAGPACSRCPMADHGTGRGGG